MKKFVFILLAFSLLFVTGCKKDDGTGDKIESSVDGNGNPRVVIETKLCFKDNLPCIKYIGNYIYLDPDFKVYYNEEETDLKNVPEGTRIQVKAKDSIIEELPHYHFAKVYKITILK